MTLDFEEDTARPIEKKKIPNDVKPVHRLLVGLKIGSSDAENDKKKVCILVHTYVQILHQ
jgi:hypothetical protein